jgi:hypothetical protein
VGAWECSWEGAEGDLAMGVGEVADGAGAQDGAEDGGVGGHWDGG